MRTNEEIVALVVMMLRKNGRIDLPAKGCSMFPYIRQGNLCRFIPCDLSKLKKGDVVLFRSSNHGLIAHRLYRWINIGRRRYVLCKGDTNMLYDELIRPEHILGKLVAVYGGKTVWKAANPVVRTWSRLMIHWPRSAWLLRAVLERKARHSGIGGVGENL